MTYPSVPYSELITPPLIAAVRQFPAVVESTPTATTEAFVEPATARVTMAILTNFLFFIGYICLCVLYQSGFA